MNSTLERVKTDVLMIGAGAAGLRAATELVTQGANCLVIGKRAHGDAHTVWAAGGINASLGSLDPEDHWTIHAADTIKEGHFVCDPKAVEFLAKYAPERVLELQQWGCDFNLTEDGKINQRYFGAQSFRRTCFVGDRTGRAILETLVAKAQAAGVPYRQNLFIVKLLKQEGQVVGALGLDLDTSRLVALEAGAVVLAAGGYTSVYARSSSRKDENNGDAAALAYHAGAALRDMEFVQFHPTGMVKPEDWSGRLVTEAVRGEGGRLFNRAGERFMERYSPESMELDARDVVARAIYQEIQEGRGTEDGAVLLDISHQDADYIERRLPEMVEEFSGLGVDITKAPMEVAPTAHYGMGGIKVDFETGATTVPGLYAIGEATAGVHGANRLGGNSLAETVVFGQLTGRHLLEALAKQSPQTLSEGALAAEVDALSGRQDAKGGHKPEALMTELRQLLWHHAGIVRDEEGLREGLRGLQALQEKAASQQGADIASACNLRSGLLVAEAILKGALMREESRGAHYRKDAPDTSPGWRQSILYEQRDGEMRLRTETIGEVHPEINKALAEDHHLDYHHLE